jgi:acetyl-CoA C-acetyltransferase
MRDVAIIGAGITEFGELWNDSLRDIGIRSGLMAIHDAKIKSKQIEALYLGNMAGGRFIGQNHIASMILDHAGIAGAHIPGLQLQCADASGGAAVHSGYLAVASGMYDIVMVGGAEKMTDVDENETTDTMASITDRQWEAFPGATLPSLYALIARKHMNDHGTTREDLAWVAVKNHSHGALNPKAQFRRKIKLEAVLDSPYVAEPLTVFDCCPVSDGGAAILLCAMDKAKEITDGPIVRIAASVVATDTLAVHSRPDMTTMGSTVAAGKRAFKMAGIERADVNVAEIHDSYTIAEIMALEDLGFANKGKGGSLAKEGITQLGGQMPVNTSGGLKARGHPAGATGVAQMIELYTQLKGKAGDRQVKDARYGLAHNLGGTGGTCIVHILEVV